MARNKYPGRCYCCGQWVEPGYGHFERICDARHGAPKWRIKCVKCASGRTLTDQDSGVIWAKRAYQEAKSKQKARLERYK